MRLCHGALCRGTPRYLSLKQRFGAFFENASRLLTKWPSTEQILKGWRSNEAPECTVQHRRYLRLSHI